MNLNIEKAAEFLDEHRPGWYNEIDLDRLEMWSIKSCVLGQLYGNYFIGKSQLHITDDDLIQAFCEDTAQWKQEISARKMNQFINGDQSMDTQDIFRHNAKSAFGISQQSIPVGFDKIIRRLGKSIAINRPEGNIEHVISLCKSLARVANDGPKVQTVKMLRTLTNCDLREAKNFVEYCQEML